MAAVIPTATVLLVCSIASGQNDFPEDRQLLTGLQAEPAELRFGDFLYVKLPSLEPSSFPFDRTPGATVWCTSSTGAAIRAYERGAGLFRRDPESYFLDSPVLVPIFPWAADDIARYISEGEFPRTLRIKVAYTVPWKGPESLPNEYQYFEDLVYRVRGPVGSQRVFGELFGRMRAEDGRRISALTSRHPTTEGPRGQETVPFVPLLYNLTPRPTTVDHLNDLRHQLRGSSTIGRILDSVAALVKEDATVDSIEAALREAGPIEKAVLRINLRSVLHEMRDRPIYEQWKAHLETLHPGEEPIVVSALPGD